MEQLFLFIKRLKSTRKMLDLLIALGLIGCVVGDDHPNASLSCWILRFFFHFSSQLVS